MKCPNCGKKMKKTICKCGYNLAANCAKPTATSNSAAKVNYFTYDPKNPSVVYSLSASTQGQPNPAFANKAPEAPVAAPVHKKVAKVNAQTAKVNAQTALEAELVVAQDELDAAKAAQVAAREELKAAKKAAKVEAKAEAKAAAKAEKAAAKAEKKAAKVTKKAENIVAKAAQKVEMKSAKATAKATKVAAKEAEKEAAAATKAAQAAVKAEADAAKLAAKVAERKNWASRLVAIALMLVSVVVLVILSFGAVIQFVTVGENAVPDVKYGSLMTIVMTAMKSETKMFGLIPALFTGAGSELYNASVYVFVLCVVVSAILAVAANINIVKAPKRVRRSLFILGLGSLIYAGAMALLLKNASISAASFAKLNMISIAGYYFDAFSLLLGGACMFISLVVYIQRKLVQE